MLGKDAESECASGFRPRADPALQLGVVLDHLPAMVGYWDRDLRNRLANSAYREWFGLAPAEMAGIHLSELLGPDLYEKNRPFAEGALTGEAQHFDRTLIDVAGAERHTQAAYLPDIRGGRVEGFFVLVVDVSDQVNAVSLAKQSLDRYRSLVRSIPNGFVLLFDRDLRFQVADGEALPTFGYVRASLEGRKLRDAFPEELAQELEPRYRDALAGHTRAWERQRGDRVFSLVAGPVRDAGGEVIAGTVVCTDVTAERHGAAVERALHAIAGLVARNCGVQDVADLVAENLQDLFDLDQVAVLRFDEERNAEILAFEPDTELRRQIHPRPGDESAIGQVARTGGPAVVTYDPAGATAAPLFRSGLRRGAAAPIHVRGELWGAISVASSNVEAIDQDLLQRLASFADLVGVAITNAISLEELSRRATHDVLTGLLNHRAFYEMLDRELSKAVRHERPLSVLMLDVDHFKRVNDQHGHLAGDAVLAELPRRVAGAVREEDVLARIGGEEFAVVMPDTDGAGAAAVAERVRRAVADEPFPTVGTLTVSIGVAERSRWATRTELMEAADQALYASKRNGRNRVTDQAEVQAIAQPL